MSGDIYLFEDYVQKETLDVAALKRKMQIDPRLRPLLLFSEDYRVLKREVMLWRTVLIQAMRDALSGEAEALLWFTSPIFYSDLEEVCELAGVNVVYVKEIMLDVQQKKIKLPTWRKIRNIWRGEAEKDRAKRK
jgi:hypothetical protein